MHFLRFLASITALGGIASFSLGCSGADLAAEIAESDSATLEFLDVGQGLSVLLRTDDGNLAALYDAGNDSIGFFDSLRARNVQHLDWALISHWHRDHAGGFLEWDSRISIDTLFYGPDTGGAFLRDSVLKLAKRFGTPAVKVGRGKALPCGEWKCQVLWPTEYAPLEGNRASAVLQISDGKFYALFTGDLENQSEAELLELSVNLSAELLQVGHHGSATSSSLRFLEKVSPSIAVISVGTKNHYGHPAKSTLHKLLWVTGDSSKILRTDLLGSIRIKWRLGKGLWNGNY